MSPIGRGETWGGNVPLSACPKPLHELFRVPRGERRAGSQGHGDRGGMLRAAQGETLHWVQLPAVSVALPGHRVCRWWPQRTSPWLQSQHQPHEQPCSSAASRQLSGSLPMWTSARGLKGEMHLETSIPAS